MPIQDIQALPQSYATTTGELNSRAPVLLSGFPSRSYAVATAAMAGKVSPLEGRLLSYVQATAKMFGRVTPLAAYPNSYAIAAAVLSGKATPLAARPFSSVRASATLTGASDSHGMSLCPVFDEVIGMWGIFHRCSAPNFAKEAAINIINASMQLVWNNAEERNYWSRSTQTITIADTQSSQDLGDDIQNVIGPCRRADNRRPLAPIRTIGELETFSDIYLDGETADEPLAYHIERKTQSGNDPAKCVFHVVPAVSGASIQFLLEIVKEAPRYSMSDLSTCPIIPIPHRYVESLLLPIVRYQASAFYLFRKQDRKETIDREYQQASAALGLADPLPGKSKDNKEGMKK